MPQLPGLLAQLQGDAPYLYHPRAFAHPGVIMNLGAIGWRYTQPFVGKKAVIGVDSCPVVKELPGTTLLRRAIAPVDGVVEIKGGIPGIREGAQGPMAPGEPSSYWARTIRLSTLHAAYGDFAALKMNIEGSELAEFLLWQEPIADQLTVSFHPTPRYYLPAARDAVIGFLARWYDYVQIQRGPEWWFFLRRDELRRAA